MFLFREPTRGPNNHLSTPKTTVRWILAVTSFYRVNWAHATEQLVFVRCHFKSEPQQRGSRISATVPSWAHLSLLCFNAWLTSRWTAILCVFLRFQRKTRIPHRISFMVNERKSPFSWWPPMGTHNPYCVGTLVISLDTTNLCFVLSRVLEETCFCWEIAKSVTTDRGASRAPDCAHNRSKHVSSEFQKRMSL